jgi:NAD(P)-dependent dehydrogenase (short-subunit alcohol dehydrogenase family)
MSTAPEQATKPSGDWSQLLANKVVIVTGAGGGIGSVIAETCVLHGARVVIADVNKAAADKVATKILQNDETRKDYLMPIELDVVEEKSIESVVKAVVDKWNTVDILVNNAAIFTLCKVEDASAEAWTNILNVNVRGCALMAKAVVPFLKKQRSGSIIQMASMSGWIAQPNFVPYSTTKGAVLQMTRNLALDLGPFNIRCNSICPGTIRTPATKKQPMKLRQKLSMMIRQEKTILCQ